MSLLENARTPLDIAHILEGMTARQVRRERERVVELLAHRVSRVRMEAAAALARSGIGLEALRQALQRETNELVLTDIILGVSGHKDRASVARLRELAEDHPSPLVRCYAVSGLAEVQGKAAAPFLLKRRKVENSRRVQVDLDAALFQAGFDDALDRIVRHLTSRDFLVRCRAASLLAYARPRRKRSLILDALRGQLGAETTRGGRECFEDAISALSEHLSKR